MTRYTVVWAPAVQNFLAEVWLEAADQRAISEAANRIDALLASDPEHHGSDLREGLKSLQVYPLRVIFEVDEADRKVRVVRMTLVSQE